MHSDNRKLFPDNQAHNLETIAVAGELKASPSQLKGDLSDKALADNVIELNPSNKKDNTGPVRLIDFYAHMESHTYIFLPTMKPWPASSVDARINPIPIGKDEKGKEQTMSASRWLAKHRPVESMCWSPGDQKVILDRFLDQGGWNERKGIKSLNIYKPPIIKHGDASQAKPWIDLVDEIYPSDAEHLIDYFAQRVQHPDVKPNHALVLGGNGGIGKDSILAPVMHSVGPWNFRNVSPQNIMEEKWNDYVCSVILRVNEARDLGDLNRYAFYEHMKVYTAAPPEVIRCQEKYIRHYDVLNVCGVIYTTNHKTTGIFLPPDDRRHYVAWSDRCKEEFPDEKWLTLWAWYEGGGFGHVAAYLAQRDISNFNPKAPPPKTNAFWEIVNANRSPESAEMNTLIDGLNEPPALTLDMLIDKADDMDMLLFAAWLTDRKNRRQIPHRLEEAGYSAVANSSNKDGQWKIKGKNRIVYAKANLSEKERISAVNALIDASRPSRPFRPVGP